MAKITIPLKIDIDIRGAHFQLFKEVYPFYLSLLTAENENGEPDVRFRQAALWAFEATKYGISLFTGEIDEQETVGAENENSGSEASQETQATQSSETSQVAS